MMNCMVVMPFHHSSQEKDDGTRSMQSEGQMAEENEESQDEIEQNQRCKTCLHKAEHSKLFEISIQLVFHIAINSIFIGVEQLNGGTESWYFVILPYLGFLPLWWYYSIHHLRKWATKSELVELDSDEVDIILSKTTHVYDRDNLRISITTQHGNAC